MSTNASDQLFCEVSQNLFLGLEYRVKVLCSLLLFLFQVGLVVPTTTLALLTTGINGSRVPFGRVRALSGSRFDGRGSSSRSNDELHSHHVTKKLCAIA